MNDKLHYMILEWHPEILEWKVLFYTFDLAEFEIHAKRFPRSDGFIHMIDLCFTESHEILLEMKKLRERTKV